MITRWKSCIGLKLLRLGQYQIELWRVPKNYHIPSHTHDQCDVTILHIFGDMVARIGSKTYSLPRWTWLRRKFVPASTPHMVHTFGDVLWFLSIERWHSTPSSVATDFTLTKNDSRRYY